MLEFIFHSRPTQLISHIRKEIFAYRKYAAIVGGAAVLTTASYLPAKSQTFDYEHNIAIMNPFQKPNIVKNGEYYSNDWNDLSKLEGADSTGISKRYLARLNAIQNMINIDKNDTNTYTKDFVCFDFSKVEQINFGGLSNFENFSDYQKDINHGAQNGRFNVPVYMVSTMPNLSKIPPGVATEGTSHEINAAFVGSKDPTIKDNPLDFSQWYFWEPQNDQEVHPGDWDMDANSPVIIEGLAYMPIYNGTDWKIRNGQLIPFNLKNGVATIDSSGVLSYLIKENPELMNPQVVGADTDTVTINYQPNLNMKDNFTNVSATANTEHYQDRIKLNEWTSDTTSTSPYSNIEYNVKENFQAEVDVGMQPPYSAIVSVPVKVRDIEAPTGDLTQTSAEAEPGITPENLAKKYVTNVNDNSGLAVDTIVTADTENSYTDASYYTHTNVDVKLEDKFGNVNDLGTFESQIRLYATGITNVNNDEHSLMLKVIGNPVTTATQLQIFSRDYLKKGQIVIYNSKGKIITTIEIDNLPSGGERNITYNGWNTLQPGIYLLTLTGNGHQVKEKVQVR